MLGNWMDEVARVMQDAKRHLHSKNWPRAIAIYKESIETGLLESSEDVSNAHFNLIRAFAESGDQSQAAEWQDKLIALGLKDQNTSLTLISRGASHREASAHRDHNRWALTAFTDAIETGKALHIAYWNRSLLHREMKQFDLELADLQSAIAAPTDLVLSDHRAECHARIMVLLRMQRKRPRADPTNSAAAAAAAAAASTDLNALELQNESLSFAHSAHLQFIEASERVKKLKSELSAANRYFAQTTQRLYSDRGYLEGVLRLILQSTGSGGLWVVSDLISLIAEYAVRRTAIVVRCDDGGGGGGGGLRAPEAIGLTFGGSRLISAVGSWVAIRSAPHQIKERVSSFPVELGERHEKLRFCPYPHDPERIIFVSHFHLHILNLVSKDVTAIGYGSQAVTIHHNSRAKQHAGKLYSFRCNELESVNLKGLKTNQIPKSRLQLLSSDSWEATAVVFDKSSLDSSILYFTVAGRHDSDAHSIRSFDLKTRTCRSGTTSVHSFSCFVRDLILYDFGLLYGYRNESSHSGRCGRIEIHVGGLHRNRFTSGDGVRFECDIDARSENRCHESVDSNRRSRVGNRNAIVRFAAGGIV